MPQPLTCPSCGAPLADLAEAGPTLRCAYCDNIILVPETLPDNLQIETDGAPFSSEFKSQIEALTPIVQTLQAGRKIEAIKIYRQTFGVGLKEAKAAVEAIERGEPVTMTKQVSQPFSAQRQKRFPWGCATIFVLLVLVLLLPVLFYYTPFRGYLNLPSDNPLVAAVEALPIPKPYASLAGAFGSEGIGPGKFKDARHVAVDGQGHIYVAEWAEGSRIQRFDIEGNFVSLFRPENPEGIVISLAADRQGVVYVLQTNELTRYDGATGELLGQVTYQGDGTGFEDIAVTVENGLVAFWADLPDQDDVLLFNNAGRVYQTIANAFTAQTGDRELNPHLAVDGLGNVYLLGSFHRTVLKFGSDGKYISRFGSEGDGPGQFGLGTHDIAVDGQGRIYVSDSRRIQVFAPDGRYLNSFSVAGPAFGLAFNDQEELFVASRTRVYQYRINK